MTTKAMTPRQAAIKELLDNKLSPPEIAGRLGISNNAVYQQLRRMNSKAPRKPRKRTGRAGAPVQPAGPNRTNGHTNIQASRAILTAMPASLDEHLKRDIEDVRSRLAAIAVRIAEDTAESAKLTERHTRLIAAEKALNGKLRVASRSKSKLNETG